MIHTAYIALGANIGCRNATLATAAHILGASPIGEVLSVSALYETAPMYVEDQPSFINAALCLQTDLSASALLSAMFSIEARLGRTRGLRFGPRHLDLDLLLFDDLVEETPRLTLPHPRMLDRRFVLTPLAEIAPDLTHPIDGRTIAVLNDLCADPDRPVSVVPPAAWWPPSLLRARR